MADLNQPSEIAREALRRLAARRLQPTPDNFRNFYHEIAGTSATEQFPDRALKAIVAALPRETGEQQRFARQMEGALAGRDWNALRAALVTLASRPPAGAEGAREGRPAAEAPHKENLAEACDLIALLLENGIAIFIADAPEAAREAARLAQEARRTGDGDALQALV